MNKNVHLISSEKETNLVRIWSDAEKTRFTLKCNVEVNDSFKEFVHIYITSDEKITLANPVYDKYRNKILNAVDVDNTDFFNLTPSRYKKIVLTNDPTLIVDRVQEIEKSVLISFAENPIGYLEVIKMLQTRWGAEWHDLPNQESGREPDGIYRHIYQIKFPQKSLEQHIGEEMCKWSDLRINIHNPKLLNEFEILEGITSEQFDEKDWARFERFCDSRAKEDKKQEEKLYTRTQLFNATLETLELGMQIRQDQLNGYSNKSGKELHKEWFEKYKTE